MRNKEDLIKHLDYLHLNRAEHGLVERVADCPWSSFHRYLEAGLYPAVWERAEPDCVRDLASRVE